MCAASIRWPGFFSGGSSQYWSVGVLTAIRGCGGWGGGDVLLIFDSTHTNIHAILNDFNAIHPRL
jgi:hypothetical protein